MSKQKTINHLLKVAASRIEQEVGDLIGQAFSCTEYSGRILSKDEALALFPSRVVLTRMQVSGDLEGASFLAASLQDAILLGGSLILLPPDEIKARQASKVFDGEVDDAFGEIANIIAGVYTSTFDEKYSQKLHFKKTDIIAVATVELDPEEEEPFPPGSYFVSEVELTLENQTLGKLTALFPAALFGLEADDSADQPQGSASPGAKQFTTETPGQPAAQPATAVTTLGESATAASGSASPAATAPESPAAAAPEGPAAAAPEGPAAAAPEGPAAAAPESPVSGNPLILIVSENQAEANAFAAPLEGQESVLCLNVQANLREAVKSREIKGVFLVMKEVGDRGFASVIKIQSAVQAATPLVVAGPQWTRKTVLQAVKYGACDILVTPVTPEELQEKISQHMTVRPAAAENSS